MQEAACLFLLRSLCSFSFFLLPGFPGVTCRGGVTVVDCGGNQSRTLGSGREEDEKTAPVAHPRPSPSCLSLLGPLKAGDEFGFRQH